MSKVATMYEDENVKVQVEEEGGYLFLHCDVEHYSKSVKILLEEVFEEIKRAFAWWGWDSLHAYTPNPKFAKLFPGGVCIGEFDKGGKHFEVIRWELVQ